MNASEVRDAMLRGKEIHDQLQPKLQTPVDEQARTQGRHAGWATLGDCVIAARRYDDKQGYFTCTAVQANDTIEQFLSLGLLDTKHSEVDGRVQQYIRTSSASNDYDAYVKLIAGRQERQNGPPKIWWKRDENMKFGPDGPAAKDVERYLPIIRRFYKGMQFNARVECIQGYDADQFDSMYPFMLTVKTLESKSPTGSGVSFHQMLAGLESMASQGLQPTPVRREVEKILKDALRYGFLAAVSGREEGSAATFRITEDYHDLLLFSGGFTKFEYLLTTASQDPRFTQLFRNVV
ncbi:hypothetical protein NliqN6_2179 [Naganishia liquefaciens]|uniref:Uncharacterized protein n=1 Tax=Naganishia liquefaciens TaxID=104408 RepID=A0A8H3TRB5_9TREE|nr:hypothetical protein NliqN6_2179 [Naganishia liquefaciens]